MIWLWFACTSSPKLTQNKGDPFHGEDPFIESVDFDCDSESARWSFEVRTTHWTGGGQVWIAENADQAEKHRITSDKAAADGSSDQLKLSLSIPADWRDAKPDASSRWLCRDVPDLTFMATIYGAAGGGIKDCRTWGSDPTIWTEIDNAFDCDTVIEIPIDTGIADR